MDPFINSQHDPQGSAVEFWEKLGFQEEHHDYEDSFYEHTLPMVLWLNGAPQRRKVPKKTSQKQKPRKTPAKKKENLGWWTLTSTKRGDGAVVGTDDQVRLRTVVDDNLLPRLNGTQRLNPDHFAAQPRLRVLSGLQQDVRGAVNAVDFYGPAPRLPTKGL